MIPFFSIVIPTFNSQNDIVTCCLSVINQTLQDFEIIIQDGLSTDTTLEKVERLKLDHPLVSIHITSEKDSGIYDAMNKGIKHSSGKWLLFLGSDDHLYNPQVLQAVSDQLRSTKAMMIYGNAKLEGAPSWAKETEIYDGPFSLDKLFVKNICHQAIFYNRSVFQQLGNYNTRYKICADWDFNFRCFAATQVEYTNLIIATFKAGGISNTDTDLFREESIFNLKEYFKINYFNHLFKTYSWVFLHHSIKSFKSRSYFKSLYYLTCSFFHAENKMLLIKIAFRKVFGL